MAIEHPQYLGKVLLSKGFRVWFKYMFYVIEGIKFIEEPIHADLFSEFDKIYNLEITRDNINIPPRSGKTTMAKYFLAYCWAKNSKSNFIYTSYSQSLLSDIARSFVDILEHPIYKAMYNLRFEQSEEEVSPVDMFWADYLLNSEKKKVAKYSSRKVVSPSGGVILFSSIGASITGFGVAIRGEKEFSGCLLIDDANKPADMHSEVMRAKVVTYFEETLLSRLNNPNAPIVNIQQRLHIADLTGVLLEKYKFNQLKKSLMVDGICQIPSQYSEERLKEIQINDYVFQSQYEQNPIQYGGSVFKTDWWKYYKILPQIKYTKIYADTALKTKEHNDYSVFQLWGYGEDANMYLIDQVRGKWEAHDLEKQAIMFWNKCKPYKPRGFGIEDKASGTGLIQNLIKVHSYPVTAIQVNKDKYTRAMDIQPHIQSGFVYLPDFCDFVSEYVSEFASFSPLMTHKHDDQIDTTVHAIQDMRINKKVSILDVL